LNSDNETKEDRQRNVAKKIKTVYTSSFNMPYKPDKMEGKYEKQINHLYA
jgi:hypothetical protein